MAFALFFVALEEKWAKISTSMQNKRLEIGHNISNL